MDPNDRNIRIFISSTFRDMHAERDHLVRFVFPELKEKCRKHGVNLIDVDLRWGVTEEDAEDGKALDICLDVIDSCRPYFLGLLGHRYGHIPANHAHSITAQEIYHGVLHNDIPRQVVNLRSIIDGRLEGKALTQKQIDCLVRCYQWNADKGKYLLKAGASPEELEIIRAAFQQYSTYRRDRSFFFVRSESFTGKLAGENPEDFYETDGENQAKLVVLKQKIIDEGLYSYEYNDVETFGGKVRDVLWERIEAEIGEQVGEERGWLEEEAEFHELFMADRTRRFVGRQDFLDQMHAFCESDNEPSMMVITGESGSGKSALMGRFAEEALNHHPDWLIIPHFLGASPTSTNLRQTLKRFCTYLNQQMDTLEEVPEDIKELIHTFPDLLSKAAEQRKILIVLDAVNQLENTDSAHGMYWLPQDLPANVRVVISTLKGGVFDALRSRRVKPNVKELTGLNENEISELIADYLKEIRREFPNKQIEQTFFEKVKAGIPLHIQVALEELRVFGDIKEFENRVNSLPDNILALFSQVLERIETDFNPELVRDCMSLIACGKHGMTAEELQALLCTHAPRIDQQIQTEKLPDMLWARLYRAFSAYLFERSGVIDFLHGQLKEAVGKRYLLEEAVRTKTHKGIADYFISQTWLHNTSANLRSLSERCYHLTRASMWEKLEATLLDFSYTECYCTYFDIVYDAGHPIGHGGAFYLLDDLRMVNGESSVPQGLRELIVTFRDVLIRALPMVRTYPEGLAQHIINALVALPMQSQTKNHLSAVAKEYLWRNHKVWFHAHAGNLEVQVSNANRIPISFSGIFDLVACSSLENEFFCAEVLPDRSLLLALWDADECRRIWEIEKLSSVEDARNPIAIQWLAEGERVVVMRKNGEIAVLDTHRRSIETSIVFGRRISSAAISPIGLCVAFSDGENHIRAEIADILSGRVAKLDLPLSTKVGGIVISPNSEHIFVALAGASGDLSCRDVWQLSIQGNPPKLLFRIGWCGGATSLAVDADGQLLAIGTTSGGVVIVHVGTGLVRVNIPGFREQQFSRWLVKEKSIVPEIMSKTIPKSQGVLADKITVLAYTNDGKQLIAAACPPTVGMDPGGLLVCDIEAGCVVQFEEFPDGVKSLGILSDGKQLVVASEQGLYIARLRAVVTDALPIGVALDCAAISPDCSRSALTFRGDIYVVNSQSRAVRYVIHPGVGSLRDIRWDDGLLSAVGADEQVRVWDATTGTSITAYVPCNSRTAKVRVNCYALMPPGDIACLAGVGQSLVIFYRDGSREIRDLGCPITHLAVFSDGCACIVVLDESMCVTFSTETWDIMGVLDEQSIVTDICVIDAKTVATSYGEGNSLIVVWCARSGEILDRFVVSDSWKSICTARGTVRCLKMCPTGSKHLALVTLHNDNMCRVWRYGTTGSVGKLPMDVSGKAARMSADSDMFHIIDRHGIERVYTIELNL